MFGDKSSSKSLMHRASENSVGSAAASYGQLAPLHLVADRSRRKSSGFHKSGRIGSIIAAEEYSEDEDEDLGEVEVEGHHGIWQRIQVCVLPKIRVGQRP